jgi:7,8-dihydroneopterin aldolase/epimerase/oxygenase
MDSILINGLEFYAYHGVSDAEQRVGHRYRIDATLEMDARRAGQTDALNDTVDYARVAQRLIQIGTENQYRLLEALGTQMVEALFEEFPLIEAILLRVQKVCPPMNAVVASVGVEIYRTRDDFATPARVRLTVVGDDEDIPIQTAVEEAP